MENQPAAHVIAAERSGVGAPRSGDAPSPVSASLQAGPAAAHLAARNPYAGRRHDKRRAETARTFNSVACVVAGVPTDEAARYQAARLASPGGNVELVSAAQVTRDGQYVLGDSYDLLAGRSQCRGVRGCGARSHPDLDRSKVSAGNRGDGHDRRARRRLVRIQRDVGRCRIASGRPLRDSHALGGAPIRARASARNHCERRRRSRRHRGGSTRDRRAAPA
jgi:hypothetical protein